MEWASARAKVLGTNGSLTSPISLWLPDGDKLSVLVGTTEALVRAIRSGARCGNPFSCVARGLGRVVGSWMWAGTLRRCFYSIFQSIFALTAGKNPDELVTPTLQHADELQLACDAVPFLRASCGEWSPQVFAWDSSDTGFGVVFKLAPTAVIAELASPAALQRQWRHVESHARAVLTVAGLGAGVLAEHAQSLLGSSRAGMGVRVLR